MERNAMQEGQMTLFPGLFEPGSIGKLRLKNRIVMPPMYTGLCGEDGRVSDRLTDYYAERARGGCGLVIVEASYTRPEGYAGHISINDDSLIPGLKGLARAIQDGGARAAIQVNAHRGRGDEGDPASASEGVHPKSGARARAFSTEDIADLKRQYAEGARRAMKAGFDCVMIHGAHGYIISEFLSPLTNRRTDDYGGDLRRRARLAVEITEEVRRSTAADYPIIFRLMADDRIPGGFGVEDAAAVARLLEDAGANAIDAASGAAETYGWVVPYIYAPPACNSDLSQAIRRAVSIPVSVPGRITTPHIAEQVLAEGKADFVCMGRALIADPDLPAKAAAGRESEIRQCIACGRCMKAILGRNGWGTLECAVNPAVGRERWFREAMKPAATARRVLVIGGGPAGMEAAVVAAQRGHDVTLWERTDRLGGQLNLAAACPGKGETRSFIDYLSNQLRGLPVKVELSKEATPASVARFTPDVAVLAVGARPLIPGIKGRQPGQVVLFPDILSGLVSAGKKVVVVGGGLVGCETAEFLAEQGRQVAIVELLDRLAAELFYTYSDWVASVLRDRGVEAFVGVQEEEFTEGGLAIVDREGHRQLLEADTVVIAAGMLADHSLAQDLERIVTEIHEVGDCAEARQLLEAVHEGSTAALEI